MFVTPGNDKEIYLAMKMMAESEELRAEGMVKLVTE